MKIYLVEDVYNSPGRIYAIFAHREDAERFEESLNDKDGNGYCEIVERTLFYGQPEIKGFNQ